jgi:hypothetical protein
VAGSFRFETGIPPGDPASIVSTDSDALALGKFNRRVREQLTAFQGGVFLGELGQTLRLIRNPAKGLRGAADEFLAIARRIRKGGLSGALARSRVSANLADAWLEVQFGWKPLLRDVDDACKALAIINTGQSLSTGRISAKATTERESYRNTSTFGYSIAAWQTQLYEIESSSTIYRGALRVDALNPKGQEARLVGFDLSSFLPTAWELIPYSFLIDYFTNIGEIIEGWSQLGTKLAWCNRTRRKAITVSQISLNNNVNPEISVTPFVQAKLVVRKSSVARAAVEGNRIPDFDLRVPGNWSTKWLNIAALIAGRSNDRKWSYGD